MDAAALLTDLYGRIPPLVEEVVSGLDAAQLATAPGPGANTIGWLTWHLARVEDAHLAELDGSDQVWVGGGWAERFGLEPDPSNSGYGHTPAEAAAVRPDGPDAVTGYFTVVHARMTDLLAGLDEAQLDRVVDDAWDPPVTLGVRLVSIADDCLEHLGQAAYARGILGL